MHSASVVYFGEIWLLSILKLNRARTMAALGTSSCQSLTLPPSRAGSFDSTGASTPSLALEPEKNIWGRDVQLAFEELLAIVPKLGLSKFKIAGRVCGRNELISDYILAKTGKYRTRKQVSSHIQVIKNLGVKTALIKLINDGPSYGSPEEAQRGISHFEKVFNDINYQKEVAANAPSPECERPAKRRRTLYPALRNVHFLLHAPNGKPAVLSSLQSSTRDKIHEDPFIAETFPGLTELIGSSVPILHTVMHVQAPNEHVDFLKTNFVLDMDSPGKVLCFSLVYSFGTEVLSVKDDDFVLGSDQPFLLKFWRCFFLQLLQQPLLLEAALRGIRVRQVIYDNTLDVATALSEGRVRCVLLWEFSMAGSPTSAASRTRRVSLPVLASLPPASLHQSTFPAVSVPPVFPFQDLPQTPDLLNPNYHLAPLLDYFDTGFPDAKFEHVYEPLCGLPLFAGHPLANVDLTLRPVEYTDHFALHETEFGF